jgi:hypothetical protein
MKKILLTALIVIGELGVFFIGSPHHLLFAEVDVTAIVPGICGNELVEPLEQCDGQDLTSKTCVSLGYATGTLACSASCAFDVALCVPFPTTATTSEPVYDSQGRAQESITIYSNPEYPQQDNALIDIQQSPNEEHPDNQSSGENGNGGNGGGGTSANSSSQNPNVTQDNQSQNSNQANQNSAETLPAPSGVPLSTGELVVVTLYWVGVNSMVWTIVNIKKVIGFILIIFSRLFL